MSRFRTLLRREWMQHHRGWLVLAVVPAIVALIAIPFGQVQIQGVIFAPMLAAMAGNVYLAGLLSLAVVAMLIQAPGMARRDQQDRSIEFWLSLPIGHLQSVGATLLMHLLLMPLLVLAISIVAVQAIVPLLVVSVLGAAALREIVPLDWLAFVAAVLLRAVAGLIACVLWLSPLIMPAMAASAWLKGWGVPALIAALVMIGLTLQQLTGQALVWELVTGWFEQAKLALLPLTRGGFPFEQLVRSEQALPWFRDFMLQDIGVLLGHMASPGFAAALLLGAVGFAALVWRRVSGQA